MDIVFVLVLLFIVGYLGYLFSNFMNSGIHKLVIEAKEKVTEKLKKRHVVSVDEFIKSNKSAHDDVQLFSSLVAGLPEIVQIKDGFPFNADEKMSNVFIVEKYEIEVNKKSWAKAGLTNSIEIYVDELLEFTRSTLGGESFNKRISELENIDEEDDLKDFLMEMTFIDYFHFFSKKEGQPVLV